MASMFQVARDAAKLILRDRNSQSLIGQLADLSARRDSNSGRYHDPELICKFGEPLTDLTLRTLHEEVFMEWLRLTLHQQKTDLETYFAALPYSQHVVALTWSILDSYRSFLPATVATHERDLFLCNLNALLAMLLGGEVAKEQSSTASASGLTPREAEVVGLVGLGKSTKEIASLLFLSRHTIANHRRRICQKLGLRSAAELIALAASRRPGQHK